MHSPMLDVLQHAALVCLPNRLSSQGKRKAQVLGKGASLEGDIYVKAVTMNQPALWLLKTLQSLSWGIPAVLPPNLGSAF